jgi:hypothetical protein
VVAGDGTVLAAFDYFQPTAEVVSGLSRYLGEPTDTWFEGRGHAPPAVMHDWGGLRLGDTVPAGRAPYDAEHWARVTSNDANGLSLIAQGGIAIGDATPEIEADAGTDEVHRWTDPSTGKNLVSFRVAIAELPPWPDASGDDWTPSFGVMVVGDDDAGVVTSFVAPSANFGA